jgi:hypothetical protein
MFCRKGASQYSVFQTDQDSKIKSLSPKANKLELVVSNEPTKLTDNILQFSLKKADNTNKYNKNENTVAIITDARLEYKFEKSFNKLQNLLYNNPSVRNYNTVNDCD